jgi:aspartate-semialdehyde dehydrogenase
MKIAVVGATGMVGQIMLKVLEERNFEVSELYPVASGKSVGSEVIFRGAKHKVITIDDAIKAKPHIALFSAGAEISMEFAPKFAEVGTYVIDNSSAWRMDPSIPLIVPEINASILTAQDHIIANPNCSTIQLVMVLHPLHQKYGVKRVVVSTYQSVTGTGKEAVEQLEREIKGIEGDKVYPYQIFKNAMPHCDSFEDNGYTKEEMKLTNETMKILQDHTIAVSATAVRVPVQGGHSESVNIECLHDFELTDVKSLLSQTDGVTLQDDSLNNQYPMPLFSEGKDEVFVGRIRRDFSQKNTLNLWIVADNLRKGAATNAVQIAEYIVRFLQY